MTTKKDRQRGSRTHGGGSHKNRRGAGHRGGRGNAGRDKHEFHTHEPLGKHGFTRPESAVDSVSEVNVQKLDEDAALFVAEGKAEQLEEGYRIDARKIVDDGFEADIVKVLGGGQVRQRLEVIADEFTEPAIDLINSTGGEAIRLNGGGEINLNNGEENRNMNSNDSDLIDEKREIVDEGQTLSYQEIQDVLEEASDQNRLREAYQIVTRSYGQDELTADDVVLLYELKAAAENSGIETSEIEGILDNYFSDIDDPSRVERLRYNMDGPISRGDVAANIEFIEKNWENLVEESTNEPNEDGLEAEKKRYLFAVRDYIA